MATTRAPSSRTNGRQRQRTRPAPARQGAANGPVADASFVEQWNALERSERTRLRRLVRMGRPVDPPERAPLAVAYGRFQRSRVWMRFFWLWFVPGLALAILASLTVHPIAVGVVIALGAQAAFAWFNLRRVERINGLHEV